MSQSIIVANNDHDGNLEPRSKAGKWTVHKTKRQRIILKSRKFRLFMSDFEKALAFSLSTSRSSVQGAVNKYTFDSETDYLFA